MMINLTQLELDRRDGRALRLLGDPYELHRFIWTVVGHTDDPGRILYRLEDANGLTSGAPTVLVQTERVAKPIIGNNEPPYVRVRSKSVEVSLRIGATYRFRSRVNPVHSVAVEAPGTRGKRVGVYDAAKQQEWFERRMQKSGLCIRDVLHRREPWLQFVRRNHSGRRTLTFSSAFFEGLLEVDDPDKAERAIVSGIGPGKGFGFGLISLARP